MNSVECYICEETILYGQEERICDDCQIKEISEATWRQVDYLQRMYNSTRDNVYLVEINTLLG